jgi:hypothetical protein
VVSTHRRQPEDPEDHLEQALERIEGPDPRAGPPVLAKEGEERPHVFDPSSESHRVAAPALEVEHLCPRDEDNAGSGAPCPQAPVRLLEEQEVGLIEPPDPVDQGAPHHHAGADHRLDVPGLGPLLLLAREPPWEEKSEEAFVEEDRREGREVVEGILLAAVFVQELGRRRPHLRVAVQVGRQSGERPRREARIGVQEADVPPARGRDPLVDRGGEAAVDGVPEERRLREARGDQVGRSVRGGVVDDDRLGLVRDRLQAGGDGLPSVERHDDDGDLGGGAHFAAFPCSQSLTYRAKM